MTDDKSRLDKCCVGYNNIDQHEYLKELQAHPAKKGEISDDSGKKSGTDWVLPKIIGSGIGYPSGTDYIVFGGT